MSTLNVEEVLTTAIHPGLKSSVVVAIDIGTYGCIFGWTPIHSGNSTPSSRQVNVFTEWPGQPVFYPKAMSCLLLDPTGQPIEWGYQAYRMWRARRGEPELVGYKLVKGYKMSLNPNRMPPRTRGLVAIDDREKRASKLIAFYLHKIYKIAIHELGKSGYSHDDIRWCVTVPAMWDNYQKQVMRRAAKSAGIPGERLMLVPEPEAAAYYARVAGVKVAGQGSEENGTRVDLQTPGTRFVVVDCGGGTVDLTTYQTEADGTLSEIARSEGAATGSYYLNEAFRQKVLVPMLGGVTEYKRLSVACPHLIEDMLDAWEDAKHDVPLDPTNAIYLPITHALFNHLKPETIARLQQTQEGDADNIIVTPAKIKEIFEIVVQPLMSLVDRQLDEIQGEKPDKELVLLVGGFANSPHLQQRLTSHLEGRATVLLTPNPAAAVVTGAVHYAYDPQTRKRRSRYTYGIATCMPFEPGRDPARSREVRWDGKVLCTERFGILVRADDTVGTYDVIEECYLPIKKGQKRLLFAIYRSTEREPRYIDDPGCEEIGEVLVDLEPAMHLEIQKRGVLFSVCFGDVEITAICTLDVDGTACGTVVKFHERGIQLAASTLSSEGSQ